MRRYITGAVLLLVGAVHCPIAHAQAVPGFSPGTLITFSDNTALQQGDNSPVVPTPDVCDWDGDGLQDLLVGYFCYGNIYFFKNIGTREHPLFQNGAEYKLTADNTEIRVGYG